jgi:hypothetical protein
LPPTFTLVSILAYSYNLKIEAIRSSETSVDFQRTTRRYIPEYSTLHNHRCENLKSYILLFLVSGVQNSIVVTFLCSSGSSVSIVNNRRAWRQKNQCLSSGRDYSVLSSVQTRSGAHPPSYTMCTGGCFPGGNAAGV